MEGEGEGVVGAEKVSHIKCLLSLKNYNKNKLECHLLQFCFGLQLFTSLQANSADDKLTKFFLFIFFFQKIGFDFS